MVISKENNFQLTSNYHYYYHFFQYNKTYLTN